jgi:hypothetical protein
MVSIPRLNLISLTNLPRIQESDAIKAAAQRANAAFASDAADSAAAGAGTNAPTGFRAAPRLSADVFSALISSQSQDSTGGAPPAPAPATDNATTAASADASSPPTLQQIAQQFDPHNLTNTQFASLAQQLGAAGALSGSALIDIATKLGGIQVSPALEGKPVTDKVVSIWAGVTDNTPPYDAASKVQGWLTADTQAGYPQAQTDQQILNALNQLDSIRNPT